MSHHLELLNESHNQPFTQVVAESMKKLARVQQLLLQITSNTANECFTLICFQLGLVDVCSHPETNVNFCDIKTFKMLVTKASRRHSDNKVSVDFLHFKQLKQKLYKRYFKMFRQRSCCTVHLNAAY